MRWSIPLATIGGTTVRLHFTFLMLLAWIGLASWMSAGAASALASLIFVSLLFLCVVLHEFGHIAAARSFGIHTPQVTLLPIGGVSSLERIPEKPWQELLMALAGPAVNLVIAAILLFTLGEAPGVQTLGPLHSLGDLVGQLAIANLTLACFNLLPVFPMDGGRVLRALLAIWLGPARGTSIAAGIGEAAAILFGFLGLIGGHPILLFIALFVYIAASAEAGVASMRNSLAHHSAVDVMITDFVALPADARLNDAAKALLHTSQRGLPIASADGWRLLTREAVVTALDTYGPDASATQAAAHSLACVGMHEPADAAMRMLEGGEPVVGVVDPGGRLAGLVTWETLSQQRLIAKAIRRSAAMTTRGSTGG